MQIDQQQQQQPNLSIAIINIKYSYIQHVSRKRFFDLHFKVFG